jgi:hypothetical protein
VTAAHVVTVDLARLPVNSDLQASLETRLMRGPAPTRRPRSAVLIADRHRNARPAGRPPVYLGGPGRGQGAGGGGGALQM